MENGSQNGPADSRKSIPFSQRFSMVDFWHPLGPVWLHLGLVWATVYLPLAAFCLTFGTLWLTFWYPCRSIFSFLVALGVILHILITFQENLMSNHIFEKKKENQIDV